MSTDNDGPLASVKAAQVKVRELLKAQQGEAIEVQIRGGLYRLTETLVFGLEDSGTKDHLVAYKASDKTAEFVDWLTSGGQVRFQERNEDDSEWVEIDFSSLKD